MMAMQNAMQHQTVGDTTTIWTPAWLAKVGIGWLDRVISRRLGIFEFSHDPKCILRVAPARSRCDVRLSDGTEIKRNDPIIELHLWNERLPRLERNDNNLEWAQRVSLCMDVSLEKLAAYLARDPESAYKAIHGRLAFSLRQGLRQLDRLSGHYGFDVFDDQGPKTLGEHMHDIGENILLRMILWTFNPGSIKYSRFRRRREVWMSVETLYNRYGGRHRKRWMLARENLETSRHKIVRSA
jgi:YkoP domain